MRMLLEGYEIKRTYVIAAELAEFYSSLNEGKDFLREPHCLVKNLDKIEFPEKNTSEEMKKFLISICSLHSFLNPLLRVVHKITDGTRIFEFGIRKKYTKEIDRGQYLEIALSVLKNINSVRRPESFSTPNEIGSICNEILQVQEDEVCADYAIGEAGLAVMTANKKIYATDINEERLELGKLICAIANKEGKFLQMDSLTGRVEPADVVVLDPTFGARVDNEFVDYLEWGTPSKRSERYYLSLVLNKMKSRGAIILPEGTLFVAGVDAEVRKNMLKAGHIEGIISLPQGIMMPATSIAVSLVFLRKDKKCDKVFMIDATKEYFKKVRGGVTIDDEKLKELVETYKNFKEIENVSKFVSVEELLENEGTLTVGRYVVKEKEKVSAEKIRKSVIDNWNEAMKQKEECDRILMK